MSVVCVGCMCSFHDTLKRLIPSSRVDLDILVRHLLGMTTVRAVESEHRNFDATMKTPVVTNACSAVQQYFALCNRYCAQLIRAEIDKAKVKGYGVQEVRISLKCTSVVMTSLKHGNCILCMFFTINK